MQQGGSGGPLPRVAVAVWGDPIAPGVLEYLKSSSNVSFCAQMVDVPAMDRLEKWGASGLIAPLIRPGWIPRLKKHGLRVVNTSGTLAKTGLPTVRSDDLAVGRLAAEHLLSLGFRHFAFLGPRFCDAAQLRRQGFVRRLADDGARCTSLMLPKGCHPLNDPASTHEKLARWVCELPRPIGVLAATDACAKSLTEICHAVGVRVPEDLALVGVGNQDLYCQFSIPPLSSVDVQSGQLGYQAAALMCRLLKGDKPPHGPILVAPRGVVQRQSTDVLAIEDPLVARALRAIRQSVGKPVSIKQLVQDMDVSRRTLERRFFQVLSRSLHDEMLRVRLEQTKTLLTETDLPLADISRRCGFSYRTRMCSVFRDATGLSPGAYRKKFHRG